MSSGLDLNLLRVLELVLRERSVARAAATLHVTPSAVSNALARLREALGDPLVVRKGRGIVPTPRALALGPALSRALQDLETGLSGSQSDPASTTRTFTLAIADAGQVVRLPAIAAGFAERLPRAHLRVIGVDSMITLGNLGGTEVDAAIGVAPTTPGIHREVLFKERVVLVARKGHPVFRGRRRRPTYELLSHVAVELVPGRGFRDPVSTDYARAGVPRHIAVTVPSFIAAVSVAAVTDLVATIPTSLYDVVRPRFDVRKVDTDFASRGVAISLSWHERTHHDPGMMVFRDILRNAATTPKKT